MFLSNATLAKIKQYNGHLTTNAIERLFTQFCSETELTYITVNSQSITAFLIWLDDRKAA